MILATHPTSNNIEVFTVIFSKFLAVGSEGSAGVVPGCYGSGTKLLARQFKKVLELEVFVAVNIGVRSPPALVLAQ